MYLKKQKERVESALKFLQHILVVEMKRKKTFEQHQNISI